MKKNHFLCAFLISLLFLLLFVLSANAETEGIFTYTVSGNEATLTEITPESADRIVIPDTLGGYPVTRIKADRILEGGAFVVEELVIPACVTDVGTGPFVMSKIARITVDENNPALSSADGALFDKAQTKLLKCPAYYPEQVYSVPSTVTGIGRMAFSNAKNLETVLLPDGVTTLGDQAFAFTNTIKNIKIPSTVTLIDQNCFAYNYAIERIVIPESVTTLAMSAFTDCISLETAVILANITTLNSWVFDNTALKTVVLPASLTVIRNDVFVRTDSIERVLFAGTRAQWDAIQVGDANGSLPDAEVICGFPAAAYKNIEVTEENGMVTIGGSGSLPGAEGATYHYWDAYAGSAETVYISGDISEIGANSFVGFPALSSVVISSDSVAIASGAFRDCENLRNLLLLGGSDCSEDAFENCGDGIHLFAASEYPQRYDGENDRVRYIPVSFADGTLRYDGALVQDSYDFFDVLSVLCSHYGEIRAVEAPSFAFADIPVYAYDAVTDTRTRIDGPLKDCTIYPQITAEGETRQISFNTLCAGIADGSITGFYLVIEDETHPQIEDTRISIVERIVGGIKKVLRAIVTLLNKFFRLLKSFSR